MNKATNVRVTASIVLATIVISCGSKNDELNERIKNGECPPGLHLVSRKCFSDPRTAASRSKATKDCESAGARLPSKEEYRDLYLASKLYADGGRYITSIGGEIVKMDAEGFATDGGFMPNKGGFYRCVAP